MAVAARDALGGADAPTPLDTLREENAFLREQLDGARCAELEARRDVQELQDERSDMLDEMETMNDELQGAVSGPRPRGVRSS